MKAFLIVTMLIGRTMVDIDRMVDRFTVSVGLAGLTDLRGSDLREMDLKNANLSGVDLTEANLSGVDLTGADLRGSKLTGANLEGANLTDALIGHKGPSITFLDDANLRGATLPGNMEAVLTGADLSNATILPTDRSFESSRWGSATDRPEGFAAFDSEAGAKGANFNNVTAQSVIFAGTFRESNFIGADLTGSRFTASSLHGADFTDSNLDRGAFTSRPSTLNMEE